MGLALGGLALQVSNRARLPGGLGECDVVNRAIETAIAAAVQTMTIGPWSRLNDAGKV